MGIFASGNETLRSIPKTHTWSHTYIKWLSPKTCLCVYIVCSERIVNKTKDITFIGASAIHRNLNLASLPLYTYMNEYIYRYAVWAHIYIYFLNLHHPADAYQFGQVWRWCGSICCDRVNMCAVRLTSRCRWQNVEPVLFGGRFLVDSMDRTRHTSWFMSGSVRAFDGDIWCAVGQ